MPENCGLPQVSHRECHSALAPFMRWVLINEETAPLKMSYYTYPHLQALFLLAGLEIVEGYGSCEKAPLDNESKEMVFVLQRQTRETPKTE